MNIYIIPIIEYLIMTLVISAIVNILLFNIFTGVKFTKKDCYMIVNSWLIFICISSLFYIILFSNYDEEIIHEYNQSYHRTPIWIP